jgi:hypothetical protein
VNSQRHVGTRLCSNEVPDKCPCHVGPLLTVRSAMLLTFTRPSGKGNDEPNPNSRRGRLWVRPEVTWRGRGVGRGERRLPGHPGSGRPGACARCRGQRVPLLCSVVPRCWNGPTQGERLHVGSREAPLPQRRAVDGSRWANAFPPPVRPTRAWPTGASCRRGSTSFRTRTLARPSPTSIGQVTEDE